MAHERTAEVELTYAHVSAAAVGGVGASVAVPGLAGQQGGGLGDGDLGLVGERALVRVEEDDPVAVDRARGGLVAAGQELGDGDAGAVVGAQDGCGAPDHGGEVGVQEERPSLLARAGHGQDVLGGLTLLGGGGEDAHGGLLGVGVVAGDPGDRWVPGQLCGLGAVHPSEGMELAVGPHGVEHARLGGCIGVEAQDGAGRC